jgi:hypothetical protein
VAHQECHVTYEEFRVPERGINPPFFKRGKRGEEEACPADDPEHHGHQPDERFLFIPDS